MEKTGIIIQARMSSTRLPGKVLKLLSGKEMLAHVIERCRKSKTADMVIVATSGDTSDDVLASWCLKNDTPVFRGNLENVLDRYYQCAKAHRLDVVVRITSDCPLIDPSSVDKIVETLRAGIPEGAEYVSNILDRNYPRGLDCEAFSFRALERAWEEAADSFDTEHVTPYIIRHACTAPYTMPPGLRGDFRLTVDEERDYELMNLLYRRFYKDGDIIDTRTVIAFLRAHPDIAALNEDVAQKHKKEQEAAVRIAERNREHKD